jgi:hypothetical protein
MWGKELAGVQPRTPNTSSDNYGFELALLASRDRNRGTTILLDGDTAIATVLKWKHALVAPNVMRSEDRQMNQQKERLGGLVIPGSLPRRNPLTTPTEPLIR